MKIEDKYEVLEAIAGLGGTEDVTVPAWEKSTGRLVFVHILAGGYSTETNMVLTAIGRLPPEHRQHVLGAGDLSGNAYIVTDALPWGATLRDWVNSAYKAEPVDRAADPVKFSKAGAWKIPVIKAGAPPPPVEPPPPPAETKSEPGEFTRMIQAVKPETPPAPPSPAPPWPAAEPAAPPPSSAAPPAASQPPAESWSAITRNEPGEFTRLMQASELGRRPRPHRREYGIRRHLRQRLSRRS